MIREARAEDLEEVYNLWCELMDFHQSHHPIFGYDPQKESPLKEELRKRLVDPHTRFFVLDQGNELAGLIVVSFRKTVEGFTFFRKGYIAETVVKEQFRGTGAGKALFEAAKKWLIERGADHIELQVSLKNQGALQFWASQGFTPSTQHLILPL